MASRRRLLTPTKPITEEPPKRKALQLDSCTYVVVIIPAFDPNRVLRRVVFLNDKSKYVSVGFYPTQNYQFLVEFGGVKRLHMVLTSDYDATMAERLSSLVDTMCQNEHYRCKSDESFEWIPQGHTGLPEWPSINNFSHSNCMNCKICCKFIQSQKSITHVNRGIERFSILCKRWNGLG